MKSDRTVINAKAAESPSKETTKSPKKQRKDNKVGMKPSETIFLTIIASFQS